MKANPFYCCFVMGLAGVGCSSGNDRSDSDAGALEAGAPDMATQPSRPSPPGAEGPPTAPPAVPVTPPPSGGGQVLDGGAVDAQAPGAPSVRPPSRPQDAAAPLAPLPDAQAAPDPCDQCGDEEQCDPVTAECVECLDDVHCGEGAACINRACKDVMACDNSEACTEGDAPVCHSEAKICVECEIDLDCPEEQECEGRSCVDPAAQCAQGPDPCTSGVIPAMRNPQVVDGYGDEFCEVPGFTVDFSNPARGASDLPHSALVRVAWSRQALHLFATVEDPEIAVNSSVDALWEGDALELFLAPTPADELEGHFSGRVDGVQLVFAPPSGEEPARAARLFWLPASENASNHRQVREEVTRGFVARLTSTGYAVEAEVPWTSFGPRTPSIESGMAIAFNFALSTANQSSLDSGGREGAALLYAGPPRDGFGTCEGDQVAWCNSTTWCSPTLD